MRILVVLAVAFAIAWLVLVVLLHTVFPLYSIPTGAMEPTIHIADLRLRTRRVPQTPSMM